ncbi:WD40 repeat domain-containing protein [Streptomyces sp. CLV115]|uniref:WD40 repeat domain-containing protein n=1 Tax=Streptomyces sp. CLV115 TaxID=3138502 RepID=UPI00313B9663
MLRLLEGSSVTLRNWLRSRVVGWLDAGMSGDLNVDGVEAVLAGAVGRLADPGFLVNADPEEVLGLVDAASGPAGRFAGAVYRASAHLHRDAGAGVRRQLLALDAARYGDRGLAARITAVPVEGEPAAQWGVEWATGGMVDRSLWQTLAGHTSSVVGVATGVVEGRPVAVTSSRDETVRVWDLATGRQVGQPLTGHIFGVIGVATGVVDGCPVAVTGGADETVRVWDLTTGQPVGEPLHEHTNWVRAVATAVVDGCPVAVTGDYDGTVWVWDLTTREQIGEPLQERFRSDVEAVATGVVDGRPVAVTLTDGGGMVRVWDLATREQIGEPLRTHTGPVYGMAMGVVDGRPVAVTGSGDGTVRVWDLTTRQPIGEPLTCHTDSVGAVATGVVDGRPVAVTGSVDKTVRVWDLTTGRPAGPKLVFPAEVHAVAVTSDGRPVVGFGHEVAVLARR